MSIKNIFVNIFRKNAGKIDKATSLILCATTVALAAFAFFMPLISAAEFKITPYMLVSSIAITDINTGSLPLIYISYYICKYFYYVYAGVITASAFFTVLLALTRGKNLYKHTNFIMYFVLVMLMVSGLMGLNYINIITVIAPSQRSSTTMYVYFVIALVLMVLKFITDAIFGKDTLDERLQNSGAAILSSFTQSFLTLIALAFPLYIFPGTPYRIKGLDFIMGKFDVMSFLPMTSIYKYAMFGFIAVVGGSLILNTLFYIINRKTFLFFNRFNHLFSLLAIIIYAAMGLNYMLCYIDARGYNTIFNTSMNTYSYIPLALLFLYWLGCGFTRMAMAGINVEYKIFASPEDESKEEKNEKEASKKSKKGRGKDKKNAAEENPEEVAPKLQTGLDPIPAFSELDKKSPQFEAEFLERMEHAFEDLTLPALVDHVIEYAKYSRERLSYGPVEVKTFISGLAASRLSILQGMSGTGKTSLPKIFMESIDGFCEIVAIESSWRDKNELLGYYNEFNKKYTPKTFTQYLYKASLNKEVPVFIVLDEMNLSRIEYYFSDFLSLMEARENLRYIKLFDVQLFPDVDGREKYESLRDGHTIDIPTNVWFIGTANRDESTFEISDKVYDRAQTMNFDKRASKVQITEEKTIPKRFVPYSLLRKLFDESKSVAFDAEKYPAIQGVEKLLRPYKISFGNRVLKQIEEFVNAYIACSAINSPADRAKYAHEAVDCILFSKVVRKLELKQITDIETLIEEFEALKLPKSVEFLQTLRESV